MQPMLASPAMERKNCITMLGTNNSALKDFGIFFLKTKKQQQQNKEKKRKKTYT